MDKKEKLLAECLPHLKTLKDKCGWYNRNTFTGEDIWMEGHEERAIIDDLRNRIQEELKAAPH